MFAEEPNDWGIGGSAVISDPMLPRCILDMIYPGVCKGWSVIDSNKCLHLHRALIYIFFKVRKCDPFLLSVNMSKLFSEFLSRTLDAYAKPKRSAIENISHPDRSRYANTTVETNRSTCTKLRGWESLGLYFRFELWG